MTLEGVALTQEHHDALAEQRQRSRAVLARTTAQLMASRVVLTHSRALLERIAEVPDAFTLLAGSPAKQPGKYARRGAR